MNRILTKVEYYFSNGKHYSGNFYGIRLELSNKKTVWIGGKDKQPFNSDIQKSLEADFQAKIKENRENLLKEFNKTAE